MKAGDVLEMEPLGVRVEILRTGEETGGELFEMEVRGVRAGSWPSGTSTPSRSSGSRWCRGR